MRSLCTGFYRLAFATLMLGGTVVGCDDDDSEDVVLPNGEVVNFNDLDDDGNGVVSSTEWAAAFGDWDVNNDGEIESNEWGGIGAGLGAYDTNGDGVLN